MTNSEKEKIIKENINLIHHLQDRYKIHDFTYEELTQELITHLSFKLDEYDEKKSQISTFIYMVTRNKLNNLRVSPKNVEVIPMKRDSIELLLNEVLPFAPNERIALEVAFDVMRESKNKEILKRYYYGEKQKNIAKDLNVTPQYISKVWRDFVRQVKEEL